MAKSIQQRKKYNAPSVNAKVLAFVRYGALTKKCRNFGICEISMLANNASIEVQANNAGLCKITLKKNKNISFSFYKASMRQKVLQTFFGKGYFLMQEEYTIKNEIANVLALTSFTIKPGIYPAKDEGPYRTVVFGTKES